MHPSLDYRSATPRYTACGSGRESTESHAAPERPQDIRPLITRHRLRRQRRRKAATLLTGASIALGVAALRPPSASAQSAGPPMPVGLIEQHPVHGPAMGRLVAHLPMPGRPSADPPLERGPIPAQSP